MAIIDGSPGNDTLFGTFEDDTLSGFGGNDSLFGFEGNDLAEGGDGNDVLIGFAGNDTLLGGNGNDVANVGNGGGDDSVDGGAGNDVIGFGVDPFSAISGSVVDFTAHTLTTELGTVRFTNVEGAFGTAYDDAFIAFDPERVVRGLFAANNAPDIAMGLQGFAGNDLFVGDNRPGYTEIVIYSSAPAGVVVDLAAGTASDGYGFTDTLVDINGVQGSRFDDLLAGGGTGLGLNGTHFELLEGLAGNDTLVGEGSIGDLAYYAQAPSGVSVNLALGVASDGYGTTDRLVRMGSVAGSAFNDTLVGDEHDNTLEGRAGDDFLDGGGGLDAILYFTATSAVDIDLALGSSSKTGGHGTDTWVNVEWVRGSDYNDTLRGQDGEDNVLEGAAGADLLDGRSGSDTVRYDRSVGSVEVDLEAGTARDGYDADPATAGIQGYTDTLVSIENVRGSRFDDAIRGDRHDNFLEGWGGADTLHGGGGDDTLVGGGEGADVLTGGKGDDVFRFAPGGAESFVTDFQRRADFVDIEALVDAAFHGGDVTLGWLVLEGYLDVDSGADIAGRGKRDTVVRWDADGSAGDLYAPVTVATLVDATLGTFGHDQDAWLI